MKVVSILLAAAAVAYASLAPAQPINQSTSHVASIKESITTV